MQKFFLAAIGGMITAIFFMIANPSAPQFEYLMIYFAATTTTRVLLIENDNRETD